MWLLFSSDWQLDYQTLPKAEMMIDEIITICREKKIKHVIVLGDVKNAYNPVDVRIVNFIVATIARCKVQGIIMHVMLGNHDRIGMYADLQNWLPILSEAGAKTYDNACYTVLEDGKDECVINFLPFTTDKERLKVDAARLAKAADPHTTILVFHEELKGVRYNLITSDKSTNENVTIKDIHPEKYMFCIGGHMHLQQKMTSNVWYVGSPYSMDWGEVNQTKGYLLVDTNKKKVVTVRSKIPGYYDPIYPGFNEAKPEDWLGSEIRVHVPYDRSVTDLQLLATKAKTRAEKDYPGATVVVATEYVSDGPTKTFLDENATDEEHVAAYVQQTIWEQLKEDEEKITRYLLMRLMESGYKPRSRSSIKFKSARATNFLSFEKLEVDFTQKGITVVLGKNEDLGHSNGAGKTALLSLISVALFGRTFKGKGQTHDRWARRGSDGKASVSLKLVNSEGTLFKIIRTRRPHKLQLLQYDGERWDDISTGNRKGDTQGLIEEKIGFTWDTLSNSVYIDQTKTNLMLMGTDTQRKSLLEQLQNIEHYNVAQGLVKKDLKKLNESIIEVESELMSAVNVIDEVKGIADGIDLTAYKEIKASYDDAKEAHDGFKAGCEKADAKEQARITALESEIIDSTRSFEESNQHLTRISSNKLSLEKWIAKMEKLGDLCPTCERPIAQGELAKPIRTRMKEYDRVTEQVIETQKSCDDLWDHIRKNNQIISRLKENIDARRRSLGQARLTMNGLKMELDQHQKQYDKKKELEARIKELKKKKALFKQDLENKKHDKMFYEYASESFSRKGLPAFLNGLLVPRLNKAADFYSKQFADGRIQVRFDSVDGDLDVGVINVFGGEHIEDQSRGELQTASLITNFAQHDVGIRSNVLMMDEPGDGLDQPPARRFAESLKKIAPKFGSVWITTHNPSIQSELASERTITVIKRNGVSRIDGSDRK